jgi:hypothetical protein
VCAKSKQLFDGPIRHTTGVTDNSNHNELSHQLAPRFQLPDAGQTAYVGKWHMARRFARPGFDRWVSFKGQGV